MLTLTIIAWIFGLLSSLIAFSSWGFDDLSGTENLVLLIAVFAVLIGGGIQYDVYGKIALDVTLWLLSGLVFLGLNALLLMGVKLSTKAKSNIEFSGKGIISIIFSVVGFISAVLGIISFYLDHLR